MPLLLFSRGDWSNSAQLSVGIVGTRRPTPYGLRQARRFATALGESGVTVVSGLARGIDGESHRATLEVGGHTIAVLGSGLGRIYPSENRPLAESILQRRQGVLISEFPWNTEPLKHHFPQRNRIISGLSLGLLVIEAGERSGSLLTVDWALRQGRPVFVVPGRVDQPEARGCLRLIQSGAFPVLEPSELLEALPELSRPKGLKSAAKSVVGQKAPIIDTPSATDPFSQRFLPLFDEEDQWHPDHIAQRLRMEPHELMAELSRLEIEGRVRRLVGGWYARED